RRIGAREARFDHAVARAAVTVGGVAVIARLRRQLHAVAALAGARPRAAVRFERAARGAAVTVDRVVVVARLRALPDAVAADRLVAGRRLVGIRRRRRRVADVAGLEPAVGRAAAPDVGRIALLDAAQLAVAALDQVRAGLARLRATVIGLDRLAVARAAVA